MPDDETTELMTPGQVAALFKVHPHTVNRWAANGRIPAGQVVLTPGGHHRYRRAYIRALLNGQRS